MEKKYDVVALGEILIDVTPCGKSEAGQRVFEQNPGGAPANVLTALSKFGRKTAFIGKVGKDMHGAFLKEVLMENGIDTEGLVEGEDAFTTLAFVALSDVGERSFSFARKPGADTCLTQAEMRADLIKDSTSELSFRVSGSIDRLEVYAGNRYKRGDLVAEDLRAVIEALNSILGKSITSQDTLNNIFRNFCIGK